LGAAALKDSGLRTLYVFTPPEGQTWGLTFERLKDVLLERDPDEFIKVEEGGDRSARGPSTDHAAEPHRDVPAGLLAVVLTSDGAVLHGVDEHAPVRVGDDNRRAGGVLAVTDGESGGESAEGDLHAVVVRAAERRLGPRCIERGGVGDDVVHQVLSLS